jgi:hypothetical protein
VWNLVIERGSKKFWSRKLVSFGFAMDCKP